MNIVDVGHWSSSGAAEHWRRLEQLAAETRDRVAKSFMGEIVKDPTNAVQSQIHNARAQSKVMRAMIEATETIHSEMARLKERYWIPVLEVTPSECGQGFEVGDRLFVDEGRIDQVLERLKKATGRT